MDYQKFEEQTDLLLKQLIQMNQVCLNNAKSSFTSKMKALEENRTKDAIFHAIDSQTAEIMMMQCATIGLLLQYVHEYVMANKPSMRIVQ